MPRLVTVTTSPAVRLCDIRDTPLDVAEVVAAVDDEASGGVNVFVGRVRDHDGGRGVSGLGYSAHPSALERLRELAVGDLAVVVATASGHRGETFAATRALIDRLKAEVPIWKHQLFTDGDEEWVGTP